MPKLQFDIECTNFQYFFEAQAAGMTEGQREQLPKELLYKIFTKGFRVNTKMSGKLSFLAKLFILFKALKKRWIIIVEDDVNGMTEEEYFKLKALTKKRDYGQDNTNELISHGTFVLGCTELINTYTRLNHLSTSPAYNYLTRGKNKDYTKPDEYIRNMNYITRFLNHYDSQKKRIVMESGLTMAEWITLTYLYDGLEKNGSYLYKEKFKYSYNTSSTKIKVSFGTLQNKGLIVKHGTGKGTKLQITALGKEKTGSVIQKYVIDC